MKAIDTRNKSWLNLREQGLMATFLVLVPFAIRLSTIF